MNKRQKKKNTNKALINYLSGIDSKKDIHILDTYGKKILLEKYNIDRKEILYFFENREEILKGLRDAIVYISKVISRAFDSMAETFSTFFEKMEEESGDE